MSEETYKDGKPVTAVVWKPNGEKYPDTNLVNGNGVWVVYLGDGIHFAIWLPSNASNQFFVIANQPQASQYFSYHPLLFVL